LRYYIFFFFFQAEDGIRDYKVTGVQTCALPISVDVDDEGQRVHVLEDMDALPFVVDVYRRDLTIEHYFIGYLLHPYVSLYTGRRSEERRVGKECRSRWWQYHVKKQKKIEDV